MDSLKNTTPKKPVIIWKAGRSEAASRAAGSHTGALTGSKEVWETVFTQYNVVEAKSFKELLELVMSFDKLPPSKGKNVFLMSISGGMGVELTDSFSEVGFCVPE
ncbi:MAG: CoA-binding protein, partial [Candidatus Methanolliviera hydrocarbonicum]